MFILKYYYLWNEKRRPYITKYLIYGVVITALVAHERSKRRREIDAVARGNRRDPVAVRNLSFLFPTPPFFAGAAAAAAAGWRREVTNFFINMQRDTPNSLLLGKGNVVAGAKREKMRSPPGVHVQPSTRVCLRVLAARARGCKREIMVC